MMEQPVLGGLGRCSCAFWLAVAFDACGLVVLLAGVFADIFFYDFLIYAGAIVIFLSLIWWVFWYTGNIEVPPEELEDDVGLQKKKEKGLTGVLRRFSSRIRSSVRTNRTIRSAQASRSQHGSQGTVAVNLPMTSQPQHLSTVSAAVATETSPI
ncbi:transmembrane protein 238-like [Tachysurus vachellii]|uniref:transmembrane protein 238-like n=1 Tax=Tachysurus vachellii TaxID=175792 RepID=UPI00296B0C6D|nr:transmembrane protein 238-like [Tachysurus vachellii]